MSADPHEAIVEILARDFAVPRRLLTPKARLLDDLGIDGDDARELFEAIYDRFGTDFTALYAHWRSYFGEEGGGSGIFLLGLVALAPAATSPWVLRLTEIHASRPVTICIVATIFLTVCWLLARFRPASARQPVTIACLAKIVGDGAWPADPKRVK